MDKSIYTAMGAAKNIFEAQTINANNLANANTTGFKADVAHFRSMPMFAADGTGAPSRVFAMSENPSIDMSYGTMEPTGNPMDIAVSGPGWFAVQTKNGGEAYQRSATLKISATGNLQTTTGQNILGNGGQPIQVPANQKLDIGPDGTISIIPDVGNALGLVMVDRIKMVNPQDQSLKKDNDGNIVTSNGDPLAMDDTVRIRTGELEGSNVSTINEMVQMIELQRKYEMHVKAMKTAEDQATSSNSLLKA